MRSTNDESIIAPIAIDVGAAHTGVFRTIYPQGTGIGNISERYGEVLTLDNSNYTLLMRDRTAKRHILQVAVYGLLLSEALAKPCQRAFVVIEEKGKTWPVEITQPRIAKVIKVRDEILRNLEHSRMPDSAATNAQCTQCEYLNYCNDRE